MTAPSGPATAEWRASPGITTPSIGPSFCVCPSTVISMMPFNTKPICSWGWLCSDTTAPGSSSATLSIAPVPKIGRPITPSVMGNGSMPSTWKNSAFTMTNIAGLRRKCTSDRPHLPEPSASGAPGSETAGPPADDRRAAAAIRRPDPRRPARDPRRHDRLRRPRRELPGRPRRAGRRAGPVRRLPARGRRAR